jgi:hypothetical protein
VKLPAGGFSGSFSWFAVDSCSSAFYGRFGMLLQRFLPFLNTKATLAVKPVLPVICKALMPR